MIIGERTEALDEGQPVTLLEVNVDDATGEQLAHAVAQLLDAGAHDAWLTPIVMKKGRPASTVSALADPSVAAQVAAVLTRETGSFGVRGQTLTRWPRSRLVEQVDVDGYPVRIKVGAGRAKVEHDDAVRVARRTGRSRREVVAAAEDAWRRRGQEAPTEVPSIGGGPDPHHHDHPHDHEPATGPSGGADGSGVVIAGWPTDDDAS